ncbi:MAG TPA: hypothetical protein VI488_03545 [Candidatus Angelobacter sp.]
MIKIYKIALSLGLSAAIILVDWAILHRDWIPLLWHLRHGRHLEADGILFTVPLLYQEDHEFLAHTVAFYQFPGHFSKKTAAITIHFDQRRPAPSIDDSFSGEERSAHLAGKPGQCVEYVAKQLRHIKVDDMDFAFPAANAPTHIYCNFSPGLSADFSGDFAARDDFYEFLANAEVVNRK